MKKLRNQSIGQIKQLAKFFAKKFIKKDVVIGLNGELGSGKTAFAKSFGEALGIKSIKSPTFIIGTRHRFQDRFLYHYDFYRLDHARQLTVLGFDEILKQNHRIVLIEWVEKFPKIANKCDFVITFKITDKNLRNVTIR